MISHQMTSPRASSARTTASIAGDACAELLRLLSADPDSAALKSSAFELYRSALGVNLAGYSEPSNLPVVIREALTLFEIHQRLSLRLEFSAMLEDLPEDSEADGGKGEFAFVPVNMPRSALLTLLLDLIRVCAASAMRASPGNGVVRVWIDGQGTSNLMVCLYGGSDHQGGGRTPSPSLFPHLAGRIAREFGCEVGAIDCGGGATMVCLLPSFTKASTTEAKSIRLAPDRVYFAGSEHVFHVVKSFLLRDHIDVVRLRNADRLPESRSSCLVAEVDVPEGLALVQGSQWPVSREVFLGGVERVPTRASAIFLDKPFTRAQLLDAVDLSTSVATKGFGGPSK
jgi:hypothetical protein